MKQLVVNAFLGMLPEVIFFVVFLTTCKNINKKRIKLLLLNILNYIGVGALTTYSIYSYVFLIIFQFIIMKILYKEEVEYIDVFLISISHIYIFIIAIACYKLISNYYIAFIIDRILLFLPLLFKNKLTYLYQQYIKLWNRNENNKIRSISLRNISLIGLNIFLFLSDFVCTYITNL